MKVIHSSGSWLPQTQTWMHTQIISLPPDIETHILCSSTENLDQFPVPRIHSQSSESKYRTLGERLHRRLFNRRQTLFWYRKARSIQPVIWHSHFAYQAWYDRSVVETYHIKHVLSVYGADISQNSKIYPWDIRTPDVLHRVDCVLCEGPFMAKQVVALGCPQSRVQVHHLGVNVDEIPFQARKWSPGSPIRVLIVGTFREKKGIPFAIEALAKIRGEAEVEITIVGDATTKPGDSEEKQRILAALEHGNLSSKTRLLGFQPYRTVMEEARLHHIFLSPSVTAADGDNEGGSPVIITEMAASGMMIVTTRHCDIPEVIHDGVTGLLADEKDVDGLVQNLRWLISNPNEWITFQKAARLHIEAEYNAKIQGNRLANLYWRIIGNNLVF